MRWAGVAVGLAVAAFLVAAGWMAWVVSQGTNQPVEPGWFGIRYAAALSIALATALAALLVANIRPPANRKAAEWIRALAGLEVLVFAVVWLALVGVLPPFP